jgi:hypothetical protein
MKRLSKGMAPTIGIRIRPKQRDEPLPTDSGLSGDGENAHQGKCAPLRRNRGDVVL